MKNIIVVKDVRILGVGYSPSDEPVEVDDAVAAELLKNGWAIDAEAEAEADSDDTKE